MPGEPLISAIESQLPWLRNARSGIPEVLQPDIEHPNYNKT